MRFYADLHIHSRFSRACSKKLTLPEIYRWCQLKGITVIGTGDFTHPVWIQEIKDQLKESEQGLFKLKQRYAKQIDKEIPPSCKSDVRFLLTVEISLIYKRHEKVRKVHLVILAPDIATVEKINQKLSNIGNIISDGRPILGLDSKDLLEIVLGINDKCMVIPAHIWTPWFSMFGDKSGFNSIKECFGDLSDYIYAIETGLSSDPEMNWMVKDLDKVTIVSNSDAHSAQKIAREANIFNCDLSYKEITNAIIKNDKRFEGTVEFYPQEGKYHHDGHRACNINWPPEKTIKGNSICPKCHKRLTVGVLNRVYKLAEVPAICQRQSVLWRKGWSVSGGKKGRRSPCAKSFKYVIPLKEILSEILNKGVNTKTVEAEYFKILLKFGNELSVALDVPIDTLGTHSHIFAKAILKIRKEEIQIKPGYDGVFGKISIFTDQERKILENQEQINLI